MKKLKTIFVVMLCAAILLPAARPLDAAGIAPTGGSLLSDIYTDKAMYHPGDTVTVTLELTNSTGAQVHNGTAKIQARHLNVETGEAVCRSFSLASGASHKLEIGWSAPAADFTGYLLECDIYDENGSLMDSGSVGVDVSSSWVKFPRYGYLYDFNESADTSAKIEEMNRYHINGIEYYDWQYRHHEPLPSWSTSENIGTWQDWAGRTICGSTIQSYIEAAKSRNMVNMAYDMIYAGTDDFFKDNAVTNTWKIRHKSSGEEFCFTMGDSPSGNGHLYFVNPLHTDWQNHIFSEITRAVDTVGFDGFHGDTVGDWGEMTDYYGCPLGKTEDGRDIYSVADTYKPFLNSCKDALGEDMYLSFNPVGAKGIQNANASRSDVLYTEFWPWDSNRYGELYDTYYSLAREVEDSMADSTAVSIDGKGQSLVVKAYLNYTADKNKPMNEAAVRLCDAVCFASGGSRIEVGNGSGMLHHEYYPSDTVMSGQLQASVRDVYDFAVAYENLLRDGQATTGNAVEIEGVPTSRNGSSDTVWTYTRADGNYEILHLINLVDTDNKWRDEDCTKPAPARQENLTVKYYCTNDVNAVYMASPDADDCRSKSLRFYKGTDEGGRYVKFVVPSLEYWNMIYMSDTAEGNLSPDGAKEDAPSFSIEAEAGTLTSAGGSPAIEANALASGGRYVHDIGLQQGDVSFTVPEGTAHGIYSLELGYSSATNGRVRVSVNGADYTVDYKKTSDSWIFEYGHTVAVNNIELNAGDVITIQDAESNCWIWLDKLDAYLIEASEEVPSFSIEAEEGTLTSAGGSPAISASEQASGGRYVHDIGLQQGYVSFTVPEGTARGIYSLELGYSSATNGRVRVSVNGADYTVDYKKTSDSWIFEYGHTVAVNNIELNAGDVITIQDAESNCWIWLDKLDAYLISELTPEARTDLIITDVRAAASAVRKKPVSFNIFVKNAGARATLSAVPLEADVYIDDRLIETVTAENVSIQPGGTVMLQTGNWQAIYGTHTVRVVLNPRGTAPETDLANNRRCALVRVADI